jgi:hypothetical protein
MAIQANNLVISGVKIQTDTNIVNTINRLNQHRHKKAIYKKDDMHLKSSYFYDMVNIEGPEGYHLKSGYKSEGGLHRKSSYVLAFIDGKADLNKYK